LAPHPKTRPSRAGGSASRTGNSQVTLREAARRLIEGLNPEQRAAAVAPPGPLLVVAGAGSGKTRVLVTRIIHLLAGGAGDKTPGVPPCTPEEIIALTFSNRSAREMRHRLKVYAGKAADGVFLGTFHSLGLRMVKEHAEALGLLPNPSVMDMHARLSLIVAQAARHGAKNKKFDLMDLSNTLSQIKEKGFTPADCPNDTEYGTRLPKIYKGYEKAKRAGNLVDFEDLIRLPIALLREHPHLRAACHNRWKHYLVDEFQDTNSGQLDFLRLLVGHGGVGGAPSVFVVGDDDQSIYGWRGAEMRNLLDFEAHFPGASVIKLQQNYRSTGNIIGASNAVIHRNQLRRPKTVFTERDTGEPLWHHVADDEKSEVDWLVAKVKEITRDEGLDHKEIALLVRTNIQLREWMEEFIINGIPFSVKGANNLLEFPEVLAVLAYAKLAVNPHDELSLAKVLAFPKRGWPKNLLDQIPRSEGPVLEDLRAHCTNVGNAWSAEVLALLGHVEAAHARSQLAPGTAGGGMHAPLVDLLEAAGVLEAFQPRPAQAEESPEEEDLLAGIEAPAPEGKTPKEPTAAEKRGSKKRERVDQFLQLLQKEEARNPEARLQEVLNALALDTAADDPEEKPGVRLMTVHAAKGLEFHTVFLPTLDDDVFPSKPNHTDTGMEEERRLFYVAMTRAKKRLFLSWPATKIYYRVARDVVPSRFLHEIPLAHLDGPLGKKDKEEKKAFLDDFFSNLQSGLFGVAASPEGKGAPPSPPPVP
jgi:DNA helicase-2/ATP-dependent DNA helicase PcrA